METRAVMAVAINRVEARPVEVPPPGPGEVLIRTSHTCISPGTELRCLAGLQQGTPGWPFILGYALVGHVEAVGPGAHLAVGARVLCGGTSRAATHRLWGGHIGLAVQPENAVHIIPAGVDPVEAAVGRILAIALHGVSLSRPDPHETVAVVGLGLIGQLSARLHAMGGARVVGIDRSASRVEVARGAGIEGLAAQDAATAFRERVPDGADLVVDATGSPTALAASIECARDRPYEDLPLAGPRLLLQGSYPGDFTVPYHPVFRREMTVLVPRDRQPRDMRAALDLLARRRIGVRDLVGRVCPPEAAQEVYDALRDPGGELLTAVFDWTA